MQVILDDKALKDLSKLDKVTAKNIFSKIEKLENFPHGTNIKKLTNFIPPYRLRVGNFRVLFDVEDGNLTVYRVKHRKDSYQ
ncbi:MAG: type II toxin-antitoxin system RelE/ParE family toxin [Campylobacterales bacterium]|nr:type II toxin-antitoxin system RelE/ParE family toxin [Campylobacterales bacterium]